MLKVFIPNPNESWIIDRIINEFAQKTSHKITKDIMNSDVVWLHARYIHSHFPFEILKQKKILMSWHHIVPDKFNHQEHKFCEQFVDAYWVPNIHTENFLKQYTKKPIYRLCYWLNDEIFNESIPENINTIRKEITEQYKNFKPSSEIPKNEIILGSFQRDTEGSSIKTGQFKPKLEKGSDIFLEIVKKTKAFPVLSGYRRHFLAYNFLKNNIPWFMAGFVEKDEQIPLLYESLRNGYYIVPSRYEGGPQAILECAQMKIKILSTNVGITSEILHSDCICPFSPVLEKEKAEEWFVDKIIKNDIEHTLEYNHKNIQNYTMDKMTPLYDDILTDLDNKNCR